MEPVTGAQSQQNKTNNNPQNQTNQVSDTGVQARAKEKPPVAAQVLYALGLIALILGIFYSIVLFAVSTNTTNKLNAVPGLGSLGIKTAAVVLLLMVVGLFVIVNNIRSGKLWALASYTILIALGLVSNLNTFLSRSDLERALDKSNPVTSLLSYMLVGGLLLVLWTKNRKYFH